MAAKILSDNKFDHELNQKKGALESLSREAQSFIASFPSLPPNERAKFLVKVQGSLREFQRFFQMPHQQEIVTAGTRFAYENLKASFASLQVRWQKFEKTLG